MKIGFLGTREKLTQEQLIHVHMLLGDLQSAGATHVSRAREVGADVEFYDQATGFGYEVAGYPEDGDVLILAPTSQPGQNFLLWELAEAAQAAGKPVCILWPDGTTTVEGVPGVSTAQEWRQAVAL